MKKIWIHHLETMNLRTKCSVQADITIIISQIQGSAPWNHNPVKLGLKLLLTFLQGQFVEVRMRESSDIYSKESTGGQGNQSLLMS